MRDSILRADLVALLVKLRRANGFLALLMSMFAIRRLGLAIYNGGVLNWSLAIFDALLVVYWGREWYRVTQAVDMLAAGEKAAVERTS